MSKLPEEIWWTEISGPSRFLHSVSEGFSDGKSVLVVMPSDMPWRMAMRNYTKLPEGFVRNDVDVAEKWGDADDVAEKIRDYIVEDNTPRTGYRGEFFQYYAKNCRNRREVFWFKGISEKNRAKCAAFLVEYANKSKGKNLPPIVMEVRENSAVPKANICAVDWRDFVTSFDSRLFAYLLVPQNLLPLQKTYLAEACTLLFEWDAEICARAIGGYYEEILNGEFEKVFAALDGEFPKRGQDGTHFLYLYRNKKTEDINHRIWEAQMMTFFPIVEERRLGCIKRRYPFFEAALGNASYNLVDSLTGERLANPYDLELSQILYCFRHSTEAAEDEKTELRKLRDIRNAIAHLEVLDSEKIHTLFSL